MAFGVTVETGETPQSAGISTSTGTVFAVAPANYGPETPTLIKSLAEAKTIYGGRETESLELYDALNGAFSIGAARAYVQRIGTAAGVAATLELEDSASAKPTNVTAKYKGTLGNSLKIEVKELAGKTKFEVIILNSENEVLEKTPEFATPAALYAWSKTHETYVVFTEKSASVLILKAKVATKLATGANPTQSEAATIAAIENVPKSLGPGQLIVLGATNGEAKVFQAMAEHAQKNNRHALADLKGAKTAGTTAATLITEKGAISAGLAGYIDFFSSACTATGLTLGTTRTIPASAIVAGLFARVARTGNDNQAPSGRSWSLAPFVTGFVNTYTEANMNTLNEAGINCFAERFGILCLYGDRTALSPEVDRIFYQFPASRERMHLIAESEEIGERFIFGTLDGRHQKRAKFQGELQGMIKRHWEVNALYGETAQEAGVVNVNEPINTPATEQAGELNAELIVRISPTAEAIKIIITSAPITEAV